MLVTIWYHSLSPNVTKITGSGHFISISKLNVLDHPLNVLAIIIFTVKNRGSMIMVDSMGEETLYNFDGEAFWESKTIERFIP